MKKYFVITSGSFTFSTYPTCRIAAYSLGLVLAVKSRSSPTHHGGDTTTNVPSCKTKTTSSVANTHLNGTISTSSVKRNDTATITFAGVRLLNEGVKNFKPSTLRSLKNLKGNWQSRKRNCKEKMLQRAERLSILGWRKLSVPEKTLKKNSNLCLDKKSSP